MTHHSQSSALTIQKFVNTLEKHPTFHPIFNPWFMHDRENDENSQAPQIRKAHLIEYLELRHQKTKFLLIAEAIGYQGGHFSGIAMTSERILLGGKTQEKIFPQDVIHTQAQRTSRPSLRKDGFSEPTATIVWKTMLSSSIAPYEFVLWNAFPWHPLNSQHPTPLLSNRTPTPQEMQYASSFLDEFLSLFPQAQIIAIGKKCAERLAQMQIVVPSVRHPANGGANKFRQQMCAILRNVNGKAHSL